MVAAITEYALRRKLRSVLDVGAGEGVWGVELKRMRPELHYVGLDPSEYVIRRLGRQRGIRRGSFEDLPRLDVGSDFDLIVCADMLQYVPDAALRRGVRHLSSILGGVAYLEAFTSGDAMEGDLDDWHLRTRSQYRRIFADAGLIGCGMHCYLSGDAAGCAVELELA
ncbi:MAG: class I SAM-dependent methyltransferase [Gemmatimonadales bacterium]